jgi:[FeFe] hydrogenase (group B1/B3)
MRKFESEVQLVKYEVLREVSKMALSGKLFENYRDIPKIVDPGPEPRRRCCIYHERAITESRVELAMGGDRSRENIIEVLESACDQCPANRFVVTETCRGCLAHQCMEVCPVGAIQYVDHKAYIDQNKCIECGKCRDACPYNAIADIMRPCIKACPAKAISINEQKMAVIDDSKCIQCGACVYKCPFGAIQDKSDIVRIIEVLKNSKEKNGPNVYAVVAPAVSSQFDYASVGQVISGLKKIGFYDIVEAALGADLIAEHEASEFAETIEEKGIMTTSCCPAFVALINQKYPMLKDKISNSVSPMIATSRLIKSMDSDAIVVFIGPCTAKKMEIYRDNLKESTDYVMTFEELSALFDAADINLNQCDEIDMNNASFFGRIFARSGGVSEAVRHVIDEKKIDVEFKPVKCDGAEECDRALLMAKVGKLNGNFIEGMACKGGCIGGPASLKHGKKDRNAVDEYGKKALEENVENSLRIFDTKNLNLDIK